MLTMGWRCVHDATLKNITGWGMMASRGRPTKLTPATKRKIIHAIKLGATYEHASNYAGLAYNTFREWIKKGEAEDSGKYRDFYEAVKRAEGEAVAEWLEVIKQAGTDGNWQASAWRLERRYPQEYGRQQRHEVTGKDGGAITINLTWGDNITDDGTDND